MVLTIDFTSTAPTTPVTSELVINFSNGSSGGGTTGNTGGPQLVTIDAITQFVGGTQADWNDTTIPVPKNLVIYAPDTTVIKIGDGVTLYANLPSLGTLAQLLAGGGGGGSSAPTTSQARALSQWPNGAMVQNGMIYMLYSAPYNGTVDSLDFFTGAGSFVVTIAINGVPVGGLTDVTVSSATPTQLSAQALTNAIVAGNAITATITNVLGNPTEALLNLNITWSS